MACASCGNAPPVTNSTPAPFVASTPSLGVALVPAANTYVQGRNGQRMRIDNVLIDRMGRPSGGWGVQLEINSLPHNIGGSDGKTVFRNANILLQNAGVTFSTFDLWLTLNLQWLPRVDEKFHLASLSDLANLSGDPVSVERSALLRSYKPADWGAIAWQWMGLYLARDSYTTLGFRRVINDVLDLLNPFTNPSLGCQACWLEFTQGITKADLTTRESAQHWLHEFHNSVNVRLDKPEITFDEAAQINFWT